ncbi:hypothetical protein RX327_35080 [Bradyrhizobium sp. BEA-2-5]|uniref:hypothetical protein n=1 Tax=Bradyrhizobium sp. BEA-2-5 TaxID=3080015 RepID=UPI00293EE0F2|nr:hypothetical protein [Bradyrhizobium sp. BEA-2-5]WOH80909.1 hypothetical protein RX327_35080 [Bradyrhizobium sp. BEA-2-5]
MTKKPNTIPAFVQLDEDTFAGVDDIKTQKDRLRAVQTELGEARTHIQRAAALAAHWGLQEEFERMVAEMIVEAQR